MEIEQKIKDYLYFHLSSKNKEFLKEYLSKSDHFLVNTNQKEIDKTMPVTILIHGLISPQYVFEEGKTFKVPDLNAYNN